MHGNTAAPERSLVQRMQALERANEIRTRRAELKRDVKAGRVTLVDFLELVRQPPAWLETAKTFDLMLALPKWGRVKVNKALVQCRISPSKTFGGMSDRQRNELVAFIAGGAARQAVERQRAAEARIAATNREVDERARQRARDARIAGALGKIAA